MNSFSFLFIIACAFFLRVCLPLPTISDYMTLCAYVAENFSAIIIVIFCFVNRLDRYSTKKGIIMYLAVQSQMGETNCSQNNCECLRQRGIGMPTLHFYPGRFQSILFSLIRFFSAYLYFWNLIEKAGC